MKKQISLFTIFIVAAVFTASATIWRVNNSSGVDADFDNLQVAAF